MKISQRNSFTHLMPGDPAAAPTWHWNTASSSSATRCTSSEKMPSWSSPIILYRGQEGRFLSTPKPNSSRVHCTAPTASSTWQPAVGRAARFRYTTAWLYCAASLRSTPAQHARSGKGHTRGNQRRDYGWQSSAERQYKFSVLCF